MTDLLFSLETPGCVFLPQTQQQAVCRCLTLTDHRCCCLMDVSRFCPAETTAAQSMVTVCRLKFTAVCSLVQRLCVAFTDLGCLPTCLLLLWAQLDWNISTMQWNPETRELQNLCLQSSGGRHRFAGFRSSVRDTPGLILLAAADDQGLKTHQCDGCESGAKMMIRGAWKTRFMWENLSYRERDDRTE